MNDAAVYEARLELVDLAIEALWDAPREPFVEGLLREELKLPEQQIDASLDEGFTALERFVEGNCERPVEAVHDQLTTEYTRLFVGPRPPVVAHESYYREDTEFLGEGLADVEASYGALGWSPPDSYPEEDDFLAVELAFLRYLIERQRRGAEEAVGFERTFLDEHLLTWIDEFVADLRAETDEDLYLAVASIVDGLADFENELVTQIA